MARDLAVKGLAFIGWIILARLLDPATFGLFAVAAFALSIFALFSQLGLGASVVRDRDDISQARLDALFTLQLALVIVLAGLMVLSAPLIETLTGSEGAGWLTVALAGALLLLSLRSVPGAMQERDLAYGAPVLADLVSQIAFWLSAILLAWAGWGIWSAVVAVLLSSLLGTLALFVRTRWRPRLNFDWRGLRGDTTFGLMYASQALSHTLKYASLPVLGGVLYGGVAVGYLTWAHQVAALPGQLSQLVGRVSYPALAQLQDRRAEFAVMATSSLQWVCLLLFPVFAVVGGLAPQIAGFVYGPQWLPAADTLTILAASMAVSAAVGVMLPALYSLGDGRAGTIISLGWVVLTWVPAAALSAAGLGFDSIAWAYLMSSIVAFAATLYAWQREGVRGLARVLPVPILSAVVAGLLLRAQAPNLIHDLLTLIAVALPVFLAALSVNLLAARWMGSKAGG